MAGGRGFVQVGRRLLRDEDLPLLTGSASFVADLAAPGRAEAVFVRSWAAHARLTGVDTEAARRAPGVLGVFVADDLADLGDVPPAPRSTQPAAMARRPLAEHAVRFVGEPVAVVVAEDRYLAEDAADLVEVGLEPIPAVVDPLAALEDGAPRLFAGTPNLVAEREIGNDAAAALAASPIVVESRTVHQRLAPLSLEARAVLVAPGPGGLDVWCSHQAPHRLGAGLAGALGLDPEAVRVRVPAVGGAFGAKSQVYAEYLAVAAAARRLGRPVRWIEDRSEAFTAATHGRGQRSHLRLGLDRSGRFLALDADLVADLGAYPHTGDLIASLTAWVLSGPYAIPAVHVRTRTVVTNATPTASYRGAGRPEAALALERLVDEAARRLGCDPVELRRANLVPEDAFPYASPTGARYDSGRYRAALDTAAAALRLDEVRAEQARRAAAGTGPLVGVGVASWIERSGGEEGASEYARVELEASGRVVLRVGTASQGQGHQVTFAQVVAEALGVDPGAVTVLEGDTAEVARGGGTFASRSMQLGGNAAYLAGTALAARLAEVAADRLNCSPDALRRCGGGFARAEGDGPVLGLAELGAATGGLAAEEVFASPQAFPFGCYGAVVEVDPDTAAVTLRRLVAVDDCGVVVNPVVVEGQVTGSIAQGIGQALYEEALVDEAGNPTTTTLLDYAVPTSAEVPALELHHLETPNPNVPLGTKGAGESGTIGAPPAILNAVADALAGYDTARLDLPLTPERVWDCLSRPLGPDVAPA